MSVEFLIEGFREFGSREAIIWRDYSFTYDWLADRFRDCIDQLDSQGVPPGSIIVIEADFSPVAVAMMLALIERSCVAVPLTDAVAANRAEFIEIAQGEFVISVDEDDELHIDRIERRADHVLYQKLRDVGHPGLILFSSGSTGKSKAAVHDFSRILGKFTVRRHARRAITFLLFDHIGGVNTMLYQLSNGGCIITVDARDPDTVLGAVARHGAELLPTSPTFMNLILISEAWKRHDLSSLRLITYGTEPMPASTLERFHEILPELELLQTYGLSEVGILRTKSRSSDSLWVKVGGEGFQTRVEDGILHIKAASAMLGYLNAASPFTEDGWLITGDRVEVDGEYLRFKGRESEIINVGGQKVYPAEIESVLQGIDNVSEATVHGESNPITGQIVCARVALVRPEDSREFGRRLKRYCRERLQTYQVPVRVQVVDGPLHGKRYKKMRTDDA